MCVSKPISLIFKISFQFCFFTFMIKLLVLRTRDVLFYFFFFHHPKMSNVNVKSAPQSGGRKRRKRRCNFKRCLSVSRSVQRTMWSQVVAQHIALILPTLLFALQSKVQVLMTELSDLKSQLVQQEVGQTILFKCNEQW